MAKIGLVASFEGLYRRTGYEALAAMRAAIADARPAGVDVIPLALDDSGDPERARRAVRKLLLDGSVKAVIGPLTPPTVQATAELLAGADRVWLVPFAVEPDGGFADPTAGAAWATGLLAHVAVAVREQSSRRLILAGWTAGWPELSAPAWEDRAGMAVLLSDDPADAAPGDAVLWLGNPADGARYAGRLRVLQPHVPFWMGFQGGDPVFVERAGPTQPAHWATWSDDSYQAWANRHDVNSPAAYLVYRATLAAMAQIAGQSQTSPQPWTMRTFDD